MAELSQRRLPFEKIDPSNHAWDPRDREPRYAVIVNRTSPSSHTRGHGNVLFYVEPLLAYWEGLGTPVINPLAAWRYEKSKALQVELFERLGVPSPRTIVVNHRDQVLKAGDRLRFPVLVKPNVGGSGAGIVRFETAEELGAALDGLAFGPDQTVLLQEAIDSDEGAIVRVEVMDGRYLYAIRIVREAARDFNLCPADICQVPESQPAVAPTLGACPVETKPGLTLTRFEPRPEIIDTVLRITRWASIDIGGVEYLVSRADGRAYFYDVNATSNFVANAPQVLGFDPFPFFADYIERVATKGK
ncbi:MAG: ATP-grasp domain-containing protein [Candidatus Rokubacteria bacterium]|nr:ATP-grasp domain-containing protein [Candidatus Rokubacteria bacterium]